MLVPHKYCGLAVLGWPERPVTCLKENFHRTPRWAAREQSSSSLVNSKAWICEASGCQEHLSGNRQRLPQRFSRKGRALLFLWASECMEGWWHCLLCLATQPQGFTAKLPLVVLVNFFQWASTISSAANSTVANLTTNVRGCVLGACIQGREGSRCLQHEALSNYSDTDQEPNDKRFHFL